MIATNVKGMLADLLLFVTVSFVGLEYIWPEYWGLAGHRDEGDQRDYSASRRGAVRNHGLCRHRNGACERGLTDFCFIASPRRHDLDWCAHGVTLCGSGMTCFGAVEPFGSGQQYLFGPILLSGNPLQNVAALDARHPARTGREGAGHSEAPTRG